MRKLTVKQALFCKEYLIDHNATQAYKRVYGVSVKVADKAGPRLMGNVGIQLEIQRGHKRIEKKLDITAQQVAERLRDIAFADVKDFLIWDKGTVKPRPLSELAPGKSSLLTYEMEMAGKKSGFKLKLSDRSKALELLCRHLGMLTDKVEVDVKGDFATWMKNVLQKKK